MEVIKIKKKNQKSFYEKKLNVAAYVRVSTKMEKQKGSLSSQINYYKNKVEQNSKWNLVDIYIEDGISGKTVKNRPAFKRLINDSINGKIDLILIKSLSRFARNTVDSLSYIRLLKENGIAIIFEEEGINTNNISSELLISVYSSIFQMERENISSRVSYGFMMQSENNDFVLIKRVYGYKKVKNNLIVNKKEAEIVNKIFDLRIEECSFYQIANYLNSRNIKTINSKQWNEPSVRYVLNNETYLGVYHYKIKNESIEYDRKIENHHEPIIDRVKFEKVQEINRAKSHRKRNIEQKFNKPIICGFCNSSYTYLINNFNYKYLICSNSKDKNKTLILREKDLMDSFICIQKKIKRKSFKDSFEKLNNELRGNKFKNDLLNNQLSILVENYINKKIGINELKNKKEALQKDIYKTNLEYQNIIDEIENIKKYSKHIKNFKTDLLDKNIKEFNLDVFNKYVSYIIVGKEYTTKRIENNIVRFIYKERKDLFENNKENSQVRTKKILKFEVKRKTSNNNYKNDCLIITYEMEEV